MDYIVGLFKTYLKKFLTKKIFGAAVGGIKGFLFDMVFKQLWNRAFIPAINWIETYFKMQKTKKTNKKNIKAVENAKTKEEITDSFHDLLNGK